MNVETLTDAELFNLCQKFGTEARLARQRFAGLLPEVFRRKLYERKGLNSIFEFAAKLAGMSEEQVRIVLNLEKRFEDKPILKGLLVHGEVSINKLARVVSIATVENQEALAEQIRVLPNRALETLVRDEKQSLHVHSKLQQNNERATAAIHRDQVLQLSPEVHTRLFELQEKGIDVNALILEMLQKREMEIAQEKEKLSAEAEPSTSRYISKRIRTLMTKEFGEKCSIQHCKKRAAQIHHTQRFSIDHTHNPKFLAPLCAEHHIIAHSVDRRVFQNRRLARLKALP